MITVGSKYDEFKTDLIYRFLTTDSIKNFDSTADKKVEKLLRIYGKEFDEIKLFIDSLTNIYHTSYDKKNNVPDVLVKNLARIFGWKTFSIVTEDDLFNEWLSIKNEYDDEYITTPEIDIELWRRIIINTGFLLRSKGTRKALESILMLIGFPKSVIDISEYVYTVEGRINVNDVTLDIDDFAAETIPYDSNGNPIAPTENNNFFFQVFSSP